MCERRVSGTREEPGTLTQGVALFSMVPLARFSNPKLQGGWCKPNHQPIGGSDPNHQGIWSFAKPLFFFLIQLRRKTSANVSHLWLRLNVTGSIMMRCLLAVLLLACIADASAQIDPQMYAKFFGLLNTPVH